VCGRFVYVGDVAAGGGRVQSLHSVHRLTDRRSDIVRRYLLHAEIRARSARPRRNGSGDLRRGACWEPRNQRRRRRIVNDFKT